MFGTLTRAETTSVSVALANWRSASNNQNGGQKVDGEHQSLSN